MGKEQALNFAKPFERPGFLKRLLRRGGSGSNSSDNCGYTGSTGKGSGNCYNEMPGSRGGNCYNEMPGSRGGNCYNEMPGSGGGGGDGGGGGGTNCAG